MNLFFFVCFRHDITRNGNNLKLKVKSEFSLSMGLMVINHSNPYIHSTTVLCDTRTQFAQTNGLTTCTRVYIINASNGMPKLYIRTRTRSITNSTCRRTQTHARTRTRTEINARKLIVAIDAWRFLHANAIAFCTLDLKLSDVLYI